LKYFDFEKSISYKNFTEFHKIENISGSPQFLVSVKPSQRIRKLLKRENKWIVIENRKFQFLKIRLDVKFNNSQVWVCRQQNHIAVFQEGGEHIMKLQYQTQYDLSIFEIIVYGKFETENFQIMRMAI